jgi:hypothetical protein
MVSFSAWFPLACVGTTFTMLGLLKVYGLSRGIVGGPGRPAACRLLGACPTWSRPVNLGMTGLFLAIGLSCFAILAWTVQHAGRA